MLSVLCPEAVVDITFIAESTTTEMTTESGKKRKKKKRKKKKRSSKKRKKQAVVETPEPAMNDSLTLSVNTAVLKWLPDNMNPGGLRVNSVKPEQRSKVTKVGLNDNFTYLPITNELIDSLKYVVRETLPDSIRDWSIEMNVGKRSLSYYVTKVDKLPIEHRRNVPFVVAKDPYNIAENGMSGDIVALWHSHGRYYKSGSGAWLWQRPLLFETVEDVFTMSYILPYVVPMLENSGAYVMLPRERDINKNEVIVDNDTNEGGNIYSQPYYKEKSGTYKWENGTGEGFIYDLPDFRDTENPFEVGSYRQVKTIKSGTPSVAAWYADIPEDGEYAVYVSYETIAESTTDALYTVNYSGGSREYKVNQTMGGGTWIYLGTFPFEEGYSDEVPIVSLSNKSEASSGKIVTADAVKIGGGMGNISRSRSRTDIDYNPSTPIEDEMLDELSDEEFIFSELASEDDLEIDKEASGSESDPVKEDKSSKAPVFKTSSYPRYLEGARYWLHWAGIPEHIYSPYHGADDYKDDYTGRAMWVNYLAGGSRVLPDRDGLKIPVDICFALHSDAGKRADDSIVGTLGIFYTDGGARYSDGTPRINSRMLTDMLMRQITNDVRMTYEPKWTRRSMWDKSYVEARVPEVPTSLIELLSHQNFADMQYGDDPNFKFLVGRAIYKAMARFMSERKDRELVIQPLPVKDFSIVRLSAGKYRLSWNMTEDKLEPTAIPTKYIIFERDSYSMGFKKIGETRNQYFDIKVSDNDVHSFKVVAANSGGMSFPSEILAMREGDEKGEKPVMIVNGFTRVSASGSFSADGKAGFNSKEDFGVPYIREISFTGYQNEFRRSAGDGFGKSSDNYVTTVVAGNTFDYVRVHGESIANAGYGFVSSSASAIENGKVDLQDYRMVDLILGKQKSTIIGKGSSGVHYKTFTPKMQSAIERFIEGGGRIYVSGQYVISDMVGDRSTRADSVFMSKVFGVETAEKESVRNARIDVVDTELPTGFNANRFTYNNRLSSEIYIVESPDMLQPSGKSEILMEFVDSGKGAAIVNEKGQGRSIVMSIPFETIKESEHRDLLMKNILDYFGK